MTDEENRNFDAREWTDALTTRLRERFGERLLFVGLQGSRRRGEATPTSDIDAVVVLDRMDMDDLAGYRDMVNAMPHTELACGFIGGVEELRRWPGHDVFQLAMDTEPRYGDPAAVFRVFDEADARDAARIGASNIYHMAAHTYVHGDPATWAGIIREAFKSAAFALICLDFLRSKAWAPAKRDLASRLAGDEAEILAVGMRWDDYAEEFARDPERFFRLLLDWSGHIVRTV